MYRLFLSLRFLRKRRINLLSVICIALGVMVLIIVYSVLEGFQDQLKSSLRKTTPHVQVGALSPVRDTQDYVDAVRKVPGVVGVSRRIETLALIAWQNPNGAKSTISNRAGKHGIYAYAIDPAAEQGVTSLEQMLSNVGEEAKKRGLQVADPKNPFHVPDDVSDGRMPRPAIIVGEELANYLNLQPGAEITLFSVRLNPDAGPDEPSFTSSNRVFYLVGVFKSGMYEQNLFSVYIPYSAGQEIMESSGYSTEKIAIGTDDFDGVQETKARIDVALREAGIVGHRITTWQESNRTILSALVVEKRVLTLLMFFLVLMACGTILAILYMMVLEKRRDIGIMKAIGAPMRGILQLFLLNGAVIGLLGASIGVGLGLLFLYKINTIEAFLSDVFGVKVFAPEIYVFDKMPVVYDPTAIATMAIATVVFSLFAAFVPAYIAARADAVRSLRNE